MPGITGIITKNQGNGTRHRDALTKMVGVMRHEPSHPSGLYICEEAGMYLGWVCLPGSFTDCMPIWNEAHDLLLLFNGEVFADANDLRQLQSRSHQCTVDNASYLIHLYEEEGADAIARMNGFFSGILVDLNRKEAILFNDRYGMQRVYVYEDRDEFLFSSQAKSLLAVRPHLRQITIESLAELLTVGCVLENRSLFKDVNLLPSASMWRFRDGRLSGKETYFSRETWENQEKLQPAAFFRELTRVFTKILPRYLNSYRPMGMSLTGGLDTRLIMACGKIPPGELPCYTFASELRDSFDVKIARQVAKVGGQEYRPLRIGANFIAQFPQLAEESVYISDGNCSVIGAAELYANRLAREVAPVRLTGSYGSEIMRGHGEFRPRKTDLWLFASEFKDYAKQALCRYKETSLHHGVSFAAFRQAPWFNYSRLSLEQSQLSVRTPYMDNDLVQLMYRAPEKAMENSETSYCLIRQGDQRLSEIPTDRGERIDRDSILSALSIWYHWTLKRGDLCFDYAMPQWVAAVERFLRPLHLEKAFLGQYSFLHFRTWFRTDLADYLREMLLDKRTLSRSTLNETAVRSAVEEHISGRRNHTLDLQQLLTYELTERLLL